MQSPSSSGRLGTTGRDTRAVGTILLFGFSVAMLLPIALTPFLGDDVFNSYINGAIDYSHQSFWVFFWNLNATWIRNGRFFPGALIESYGLFHIMPSLAVYKVFQVLITLANIATFLALLRLLRISRTLSVVGTTLLVAAFQVREYHDGLLGFSGNIQFIMELALLSIGGIILAVRRNDTRALAFSLFISFIGLLTYEVTYFFWIAYFVVLLVECPWRRAIRLIAPFIALSGFVVAIQLYVKATAHTQPDADYNVQLDIISFAAALFEQFVAAIPLTYVTIDPSHLYAHGSKVFAGIPPWVVAAIFLICATAVWRMTAGIVSSDIAPGALRILAGVGATLWLTPAIFVASTARYQRELALGNGRVPVYIEYFGFTMVAFALGLGVIRRYGSPGVPARMLIAVAIAGIASVTYASNASVIASFAADKDSFVNMQAALKSGLLANVPPDADLYVDASIAPNRYLDDSPADAKYYYYHETGVRVDVHSIGTLPALTRCAGECKVAVPSFELINVARGDSAGFDAFGHVVGVASAGGEVRSFARNVRVFIRGVQPAAPVALTYIEHGCGSDRSVTQMLVPLTTAETFQLKNDCGTVEMNSLKLTERAPGG